ncbi:MAG: glycosyltransferase [Tepidisphaeraceae bacterium]
MRIGFWLAGNIALSGGGNGVRAQARHQAAALERLGHEVVRLNPWNVYDTLSLDVVQFFVGGYSYYFIEELKHRYNFLSYAPMVDSNEPHWRYRMACRLGRIHPRFHTVQGMIQQQAESADVVIVRSTHERDRFIHSVGISPAKIELVLNGADAVDNVDPELARRQLDLPREYIAHVSSYTQPRKNVVRLCEVVGPLGYPIVIAGSREPGPIANRLSNLARQYKNIHLLGFLDEPVLQSLYAGARAFALPSIHEGTGLVAVEAATHGVPVVITKNGGPKDYFLDMAHYVDPFDKESIRQGIVAAWNEGPNKKLQQHVLTNLTWDKSADALIAAYQRHLRRPPYLSEPTFH